MLGTSLLLPNFLFLDDEPTQTDEFSTKFHHQSEFPCISKTFRFLGEHFIKRVEPQCDLHYKRLFSNKHITPLV